MRLSIVKSVRGHEACLICSRTRRLTEIYKTMWLVLMQNMHIYTDIDSAWQLLPGSAYALSYIEKWTLCVDLQTKSA